MALIRLDEPTTKRIPPDTFSLWALAFRPFDEIRVIHPVLVLVAIHPV